MVRYFSDIEILSPACCLQYFTFIYIGWVYPVISHWAWSDEGWMKSIYCYDTQAAKEDINQKMVETKEVICYGYKDFAGSGVVHVFAATCALVGCYIIGPRTGRFGVGTACLEIQRHSLPLTSLGGFILMFGFLAFNGGSQVLSDNDIVTY